jgi:Tfp pilus assembly protein PilF
VLALVLALTLTGCTDRAQRVDSGLRKAARYIGDGQWDKARVETRNVLQIDPRNARAYALEARVAEGTGDYPRAWTAWSQSAELAPDDPDAQAALARLRLLSGDVDGAERALVRILGHRADHPGARVLKAAVRARRGQFAAAIADLRDLVAHQHPPTPDASLLLAALLSQQGDRVGALQVMEGALEAEPANIAMLAAAAQLCETRPADDTLDRRALAYHRRATRSAPQDLSLWRSWAAFHLRRHEIDQAEAVLRESTRADPRIDVEAATLTLIDFLAEYRGAPVAEVAAVDALAARPDSLPVRMRLVDLYDDNGQHDDATRTLVDLVGSGPKSPSALAAQDRLAERAFAAGNSTQALAWLARTLAMQARDAQALRLRGRIALARGDAPAAIVDLRTAVHEAPAAVDLVGLLAQAYRANGEPQLARDVLADAVRFNPDDASLRLLLAADMADSRDTEGAVGQLDVAIARAPHDARAYAAKARLALQRKDADTAEKIWRARLAAMPDDPDAWLDVAAMRQLRHDPKGALAVFDQGARAEPGRLAIAVARAEWMARQGNADAAVAAYEGLSLRSPDDPAIANNLAWLLAQRHGDKASLLRASSLAQRFSGSREPRYLDTLGWIQFLLGQTAPAAATLEHAARLAPDAPLIALHLGLALHARGETARAAALMKKALAGGARLPDSEQALRLLGAG